MRRILTTLAATFAAAYAYGGSLAAVELSAGDNNIPTPARAVLLHAVSTNDSGTVTLKKVTAFDSTWEEARVVTNVNYTTAWSNLTHTVTNDIVSAWRTNLVGTVITDGATNQVVTTNCLARAVNAVPSVYPWPDLLVTTNKAVSAEVYTNIPYSVAADIRVETVMVRRHVEKYVTNDLVSATLSSGFKTNALSTILAPGEFIYASGTAFAAGKVQLILEK